MFTLIAKELWQSTYLFEDNLIIKKNNDVNIDTVTINENNLNDDN